MELIDQISLINDEKQVEDDDEQHLMGVVPLSVFLGHVVDGILAFLHLEQHIFDHVVEREHELYHLGGGSIAVVLEQGDDVVLDVFV